MYEKPQLNRVGKAEEVILGMVDTVGSDLDITWMPGPDGFASDPNQAD
jgi:hypothetical protein